MIPGKYTCDGADVSPPLNWGALPAGTKSLALICDDPDAPVGNWVHWVYYDIPAGTKGLQEKVATDEHPATGLSVPAGIIPTGLRGSFRHERI